MVKEGELKHLAHLRRTTGASPPSSTYLETYTDRGKKLLWPKTETAATGAPSQQQAEEF